MSLLPPVDHVTVEEVEAMFEQAATHPPRPSRRFCEAIARMLRRKQDEFSLVRERPGHERQTRVWFGVMVTTHSISVAEAKRRRDAFNLLRRAIKQTRKENEHWGPQGWVEPEEEPALEALSVALTEAEPWLLGEPVRRGWKLWHEYAPEIADSALRALADCGRRARTVSRRSIAAHFTELALRRIGFENAEREAIADLWMREQKKRPR